MSDQITIFQVQQYSTNVQLLLQQKGSKLRKTVTEGSQVGKQASPVDQIAATVAKKRTSRYPALTAANTAADRRWVFPSDYDVDPELIDSVDKLKMLSDPQSSYVTNTTYALGRGMDLEITSSFFGTAKTGEQGATSTTFPAGQQVAVTVGAGAATGLNVAKLRAAKKLLLAAMVDLDNDDAFCAISAVQHDNLLGEIQAINLDYTDRPVLVEGRITRFMGFTFINSELLPVDGSTYRRVPVWVKSGMYLGIWQEIVPNVSQRNDLAGLPWQVYAYGTFGATRLEEKKIVEIKCSE